MQLLIENVRGFAGSNELPIRPITILIGENSSGKTTLLAAIYSVLNRDFPTGENLFNRPPFELGSYDTIATYRGGKYGRAAHFSLGWSHNEDTPQRRTICARYINERGSPKLHSFVAQGSEGQLKISVKQENVEFELTLPEANAPSKKLPAMTVSFSTQLGTNKTFRLNDIFHIYLNQLEPKVVANRNEHSSFERIYSALSFLTLGMGKERPHVTALAPLRTRPRLGCCRFRGHPPKLLKLSQSLSD